jgi:hypothetical protein
MISGQPHHYLWVAAEMCTARGIAIFGRFAETYFFQIRSDPRDGDASSRRRHPSCLPARSPIFIWGIDSWFPAYVAFCREALSLPR